MVHRGWAAGVVVLGLGLVMGLNWAFAQGDSDKTRQKKDVQQAALMRAKLASSQKVVEGLVSKDFDIITRGAEEMLKICKATEWEAHEDEAYSHHRKELMKQSERIIKAAARENLDGAAYSYIHALTTCITCHEYCRDVLKIADSPSSLKVIQIPTTVENDDMPTSPRPISR